MNLPKFKFNTNEGMVAIDDNYIFGVTDININRKIGEPYSTVTLTFNAEEVEVEGDAILLPNVIRRSQSIEKAIDMYREELKKLEELLIKEKEEI